MNRALFTILILLINPSSSSSTVTRRVLHEPLFPIQWTPPPPSPSDPFPQSPPSPPSPFFPDSPPNNIQTPPLPISSQPSNHQRSRSAKSILIGVSVLLSLLALLAFTVLFLYRRRIGRPPDTRKLIGGGDDVAARRFEPAPAPEFLYLGTMEPTRGSSGSVCESPYRKLSSERAAVGARHPSPELQPLPPLIGPDVSARAVSSDDDAFYTPNR